jgi:hypothetical protein
MRLNILVALSFSLLVLFAIEAYAIEEGDSGLSADQLIDVSNGVYSGAWGEQGNPKEARAHWSEQNDAATEKPAESSNTSISPATSPQTVAAPLAASAAGNWSFSLIDSQNRIMALTLYQSEGTLVGTGTIDEINGTETVSALGSLDGDKIDLNVTSLGTASLYILSLTKTGNNASGKYTLFPSGEEPLIGTAEGILLNPARN